MRARRETAGARRLVALILSLTLVFSGLMGMIAHAGHDSSAHTNRGHTSRVHTNLVHTSHVHNAGVVSASAHVETLTASLPGSQHQHQHQHAPAGTQHDGMCLDLVCHGGVAVLPTGDVVATLALSIVVGHAPEPDVRSVDPAPLDRPPSRLRS